MAITEGPSVKNEQDDKIDSEETEEVIESIKEEEYDIIRALKATGHEVCTYPNGLMLGVHIEGIPGRRGVHVDFVYVLDLRRTSFGKAPLAMQAAVLETLNRDLSEVLQDIETDHTLSMVTKKTLKGKIDLPLLKANPKHPGTMMHHTRTVYVITGDGRPKTDFSWLTEPSRVLHADAFLLARRSDMRSFLSEMQNRILLDKWELLGDSITKGWFGILSMIFGLIGLLSLVGVLLASEGSILIPLVATATGSLVGIWMTRESRRNVDEFNELLREEQAKVNRVGDGYRIDTSILNNEDMLNLQRDLGFVVSPLLASVAGSISIGDYDNAVSSACLVLDECVRFSRRGDSTHGDDGLSKFIGLFQWFNVDIDDAELSVCYAGLTNHLNSPLSEDEVLRQCTVLSDSLYNVGILRPTVKDRIDDLMNQRAMKENLEYLTHEMDSETEPSIPSSDDPEDDRWFTDQMLHEDAGEESADESIPEIVAETHPDDLEGGLEQTMQQLDDLSAAASDGVHQVGVEPKASDIVQAVRTNRGGKRVEKKEGSVEDEITAG